MTRAGMTTSVEPRSWHPEVRPQGATDWPGTSQDALGLAASCPVVSRACFNKHRVARLPRSLHDTMHGSLHGSAMRTVDRPDPLITTTATEPRGSLPQVGTRTLRSSRYRSVKDGCAGRGGTGWWGLPGLGKRLSSLLPVPIFGLAA